MGKGTRAEARARGSASGPEDADRARRGEGPSRRECGGAPGLSLGLGLADGGAVGVGIIREPRNISPGPVRAPDAGRGTGSSPRCRRGNH